MGAIRERRRGLIWKNRIWNVGLFRAGGLILGFTVYSNFLKDACQRSLIKLSQHGNEARSLSFGMNYSRKWNVSLKMKLFVLLATYSFFYKKNLIGTRASNSDSKNQLETNRGWQLLAQCKNNINIYETEK